MTENSATKREHEHYTISTAFGRPQRIWSTRSECVVCGSGHEAR